MMFYTILTLFLSISVAAGAEDEETVNIPLETSPPSSSSDPIEGNFQSFSIEAAFWADYAGNNSHPNRLSDTLFANLRELNNGVPQILRIGGITQDHTTYIPDQEQSIINYWEDDDAYGSDRPDNSSVGPAFWESYNAINGTQYIVGLNFMKNDSDYLSNLDNEVQQSLKSIPADRLHLFEVGNECDDGYQEFRAPDWTQNDYVEEWINRTRHIQTSDESLRFFAPSFSSFNISTDYSFFSPWTLWNDTFDYDRDGWVEEVSQHGYMEWTGNDPTLQETLMNHTNIVEATQPHVDLNILHRENGREYTVGETNSISGQGSEGVSDVLGSALWLVDYSLYLAAQGITRVYFHQGTNYRYAAWLPIALDGNDPRVNPPYYGHVFVAKFLGSSNSTVINNVNLDSDYYSAYAAYESERLSRVAILNLNMWDPADGEDDSEPSTNADDRPKTTFDLGTLEGYRSATVEVLTGPGASSDEDITVAGMSYDYDKEQGQGVKVGKDVVATLQPGTEETFSIEVGASEAVIVTFHPM